MFPASRSDGGSPGGGLGTEKEGGVGQVVEKHLASAFEKRAIDHSSSYTASACELLLAMACHPTRRRNVIWPLPLSLLAAERGNTTRNCFVSAIIHPTCHFDTQNPQN